MANMLEQEFYIASLITAELNGSLSTEERVALQTWKDASPDNLSFYEGLVAEERFLQEFNEFNQIDTTNIWQLTEAGLNENRLPKQRQNSVHRITRWSRIAGIAAAITVLALCVYFFTAPHESDPSPQIEGLAMAQDIQPGNNGATITLSSGAVIKLSELKNGVIIGTDRLAYEDGSTVEVGRKMQNERLTASTAKGETYQFTLPDNTKVWLNADSKLSFAQRFTSDTREVFLDGEAYFEVAKDKSHPFIVSSKGQKIEVLGTHFNVNSYSDEPATATTLLEGSVKIEAGNAQKIIKPGEQALNRSGVMSVREIDLDNVVDWKNGDFFLNHIEFKTAMRKVARWYNMEVIYDENVPDNMESGGWIARDKPLSAVLKSIEASGLVKFKVEGRKIYVIQ